MRRENKVAVVTRRLRLGLAWAALLVSAATMPATAQTVELPSGSLNLRDLQQAGQGQQQGGQIPSALDRVRLRGQMGSGDSQQYPQTPFDSRMNEAGYDRSEFEKPSALEIQYRQRTREKLRQFGYDIGDSYLPPATGLLSGSVPDDYVLGIGDELVVTLRGQVNNTVQARVDREGRVVLPNMPPVAAAGRRFDEFREDLTAQAQSSFVQTNVFVSVGSVRAIGVLVTGEVREPGRFTLTSFSSLMDALTLANGIVKTGSLRAIKIVRDGQTLNIDLYDVLLGRRAAADLRLRDGDQVIVPAIGDTIAIQGDVVRPGIYELRPGGGRPSLDAALELAGGPQRPRGNRLDILRLDKDGRNQVLRNAAGTTAILPGDVLMVELPRDAVALEGGAELPGDRGLSQVQTLRDLMRDPYLLQSNPYLPLAVVDTEDPVTRQRRYVAIDLQRVMDGTMNVTLRERDRVIILTRDDVRYLASADVQAVLRGEPPPSLRLSVDTQIADEKLALAGQPRGGNGGGQSTGRSAAASARAGQQAGNQVSDRDLMERYDPWPKLDDLRNKRGDDAPERKGLIGTYQETLDEGGRLRLVESDVKCTGLQRLASLTAVGQADRFSIAQRFGRFDSFESRQLKNFTWEDRTRRDSQGNATSTPIIRRLEPIPLMDVQACPKLFDRHPDLLPFLLEYAAAVEGEVRYPGVYPVVPGAQADSVLAAVGGMTLDADASAIEVTAASGERRSDMSAQQLLQSAVNPGDVVRVSARIQQRETGVVEVAGEVMRPGRYDIRRGERLSELLRRVDGLSPYAYPYGAVFQRERVRLAEEESFRRAARELEQSIPTLLANSQDNAQASQGAIQFLQGMINNLYQTEAVGRVVVEVDPTILAARPELDFVLEPGDKLVIPKRPAHVSVVGEVRNPSSVMFVSGQSAREYIRKAGGFATAAESSDSFVIYPNGESEPLRLGRFSDGDVPIPPGSTIVVPRDPQPFSFLTTTRTVASLISSLALSAASLAVISNN